MDQVTIATAKASLVLALMILPASEKLEELMPVFQASAFTAMAANNSIQIAKRLREKELEP